MIDQQSAISGQLNEGDKTKASSVPLKAEKLVGIPFEAESFPLVLNFDTAQGKTLSDAFGHWPPPVAERYKRPYHLKGAKSVKSWAPKA